MLLYKDIKSCYNCPIQINHIDLNGCKFSSKQSWSKPPCTNWNPDDDIEQLCEDIKESIYLNWLENITK